MSKQLIGSVAGVVAACAGSAMAQTSLISFTYSDLAASYVHGGTTPTNVFQANAVSVLGGLQTGGDVSRIDVSPNQTANFLTGFRAGVTPATVNLTMNVNETVVIIGGNNTRDASGTFTLTDDDGDKITGVISGRWTDLGAGFDSFQGLITSASIVVVAGGDDTHFNGIGSGPPNSFVYAGLPLTGLSGSLVELQLTQGIFFDSNFGAGNNVSSQASGILVPTPGAMGLLGLGALAAGRRRRRA